MVHEGASFRFSIGREQGSPVWKRQQLQTTSGTANRSGQGSEGEAVTTDEDNDSTGDRTQQQQRQLCSLVTAIHLDAETWD